MKYIKLTLSVKEGVELNEDVIREIKRERKIIRHARILARAIDLLALYPLTGQFNTNEASKMQKIALKAHKYIKMPKSMKAVDVMLDNLSQIEAIEIKPNGE